MSDCLRLLFSTNNLPGSIAIRWFSWSDWSHVDVLSPCGTLAVGAHPWAGVREYNVAEVKQRNRAWALVEYTCPGEPAYRYARTQIGKPYDYGAIFNFIGMGRKWECPDRWMCSELGYAAANQDGCSLLRRPPDRVTPQNLFESALGTLIDEGKRD